MNKDIRWFKPSKEIEDPIAKVNRLARDNLARQKSQSKYPKTEESKEYSISLIPNRLNNNGKWIDESENFKHRSADFRKKKGFWRILFG